LQVRVLALADKRAAVDPATMARQADVDAILCLGDLDRAWIESIVSVPVPRIGVHGNHDPEHFLRDVEVEDLHMRRTALGGLTLAGFEGCVRYSSGANHQYTQKEASKLARKLPGADILLCHCPPFGINDDPDDPAHVGFEGLRDWLERHQPRHILHGHTHPMPARVLKRVGDTQVHYISGAKVLNLN
jgi:Icc-related predicted phosphoesterase